MSRIVYIAGGVALLALAVAKCAGLLYLLSAGREIAPGFVVKQAVYAVGFVAGGVGLLRAGRSERK